MTSREVGAQENLFFPWGGGGEQGRGEEGQISEQEMLQVRSSRAENRKIAGQIREEEMLQVRSSRAENKKI